MFSNTSLKSFYFLCLAMLSVTADSSTPHQKSRTKRHDTDIHKIFDTGVTKGDDDNGVVGGSIDVDKLEAFLSSVQTKLAKIEKLESELKGAVKKIKWIKLNPVPLGFIYIEYSKQLEPALIWPEVQWAEITSEYAGLFFRAEGNRSEEFGVTQNQEAPHIYHASSTLKTGGQQKNDIVVSSSGPTDGLFTGPNGGYAPWWSLQLYSSGSEVRPVNQAVRFWKRVA